MSEAPDRIPELDGLRGIAVLAVIASHYAITRIAPLFSSGWMGVSLFFVLSGFLITTILRRTSNHPHYYRRFWARRARRIWPLAYAVLAAYYLTTWSIAPGLALEPIWIVLTLFVQAIVPPGVPGGIPLWMAHYIGVAWSLSVEEWFYVVWAPVVKICTARRLVTVCVALIVAEPVVRGTMHQPGFPEYFLFVTRVDSLAWGALVALLLERAPVVAALGRHASWIVWAAVGVIVATILWTANGDRDLLRMALVGYSAIDAACAAVVAAFVVGTARPSGPARLCRVPALRYAGVVSYGMYLFHMPAFDLTRFALSSDTLWTRVVAFAATAGLASASWRYVESPILRASRSERPAIVEALGLNARG